MRKGMKKVLCLILAGLMVFSLVACGKTNGNSGNNAGNGDSGKNDSKDNGGFLSGLFGKDDGNSSQNASSKDYVFKEEALPFSLGDDAENMSFLQQVEDNAYFVMYEYDDTTGVSTNSILRFNMTNGEKSSYSMPSSDSEYYYSYSFDKDGNMYAIKNNYEYNETTGESKDEYHLVAFDNAGKEKWAELLDMNDGWLQNTICLSSGTVLLIFSNKIMTLDTTSRAMKKVMDIPQDRSMEGVFELADGRLLAIEYGETRGITELNLETGTLSEPVKLPGSSYNYSFTRGIGCDLFAFNQYGIYGYNLGDEDYTKIMDMVDSDIDTYGFNSVYAISDKEFIVSYNDSVNYDTTITKITKVDPKDIKDKKIITIAGVWIPSNVKSDAIAFNKTSEEIRFKLTDYSMFNTDDDYTAGITKLNTDIISGNAPDILMGSDELPMSSYIAKGLFCDLNKYFEEDFNKEDYMTNILDIYSTNGKLYQLPISFQAMTMAAKTSLVGDRTTWTMEDMKKIVEANEGMTYFGDQTTRGEIMNYVTQLAFSQYVDLNTGKCGFDSPEFIALLEFIKQFPEEFDYEKFDYENYDYANLYRKNKALLSYCYLSSFSNYNYMKKGTFGEDITLIGFPSADGNGSAVSCYNRFTILNKSKNKDEAWDFISKYMSKEVQDKVGDQWGGWPLLKASIDQLGETAKEGNFWMDENNVKQYYDDTYYLNDEEIVLEKITDEEIQDVKDFLGTLSRQSYYDTNVTDIINEEAAAFFSGQKTASEVAQVIQSRVQIYVNENR